MFKLASTWRDIRRRRDSPSPKIGGGGGASHQSALATELKYLGDSTLETPRTESQNWMSALQGRRKSSGPVRADMAVAVKWSRAAAAAEQRNAKQREMKRMVARGERTRAAVGTVAPAPRLASIAPICTPSPPPRYKPNQTTVFSGL